jgi:tRNA pseudouridine32 synthase/23S rRNA pseudouridine746 synthase
MHRDGIHVLYQDEALLVLDKPAGLLSVPGRGPDKQDCLSTRAQQLHPDALIVHRLDMATSGIMILARGADSQRTLNQAFASRAVLKRYTAVVSGQLAPPPDLWGEIKLAIGVDWPNRPLRIIDHVAGKPSQTRWRVLSYDAQLDRTRVELEPITGRSHQLRVHLLALGHPIVGDQLYAPPAIQALSPRLLLHACVLELQHPTSGQLMRFESGADF